MQKTVDYNNNLLHYRVTGTGKPVVLLHGFGEDSSIWDNQINFLQDHYQLIIPDLPGSGDSKVENWSTVLQKESLTIEWLADAVKTILTKEQTEPCTLIGHSMGGYITLAFAEKYPELLEKIGLFHSTAFADSAEKIQTRRKSIAFIKEYGSYLFLKQSIPNLFAEKFKTEQASKIETLIDKGKNFAPEALIQYYEAMIKRPDRTAVLKNWQKPVLFLLGKFDPAAPLQDCLQQVHLPAISHVHILQNSAHMGMWEETLKANEALAHFLHS
jgi:pimeloyl-ACP methyl ester carboxylesterase